MWSTAENFSARSESFREDVDDEEALRWAALERLPTYRRIRRGIFRNMVGDTKEIDIHTLQAEEQKIVLDRLINSVDDDWESFFARVRRRFDRVVMDLPKVEVRFQNLTVESFVHVGSRALPTISNFIINMTEALFRQLRIHSGKRRKLTILDDISGIIRPGRHINFIIRSSKLWEDDTAGKVTYNGHALNEFVPQRTSAYISQQDWHIAEMTVRETLDFSARCQGVGYKYDMLLELLRREKVSGTKPDEDLDIFMKVISKKDQEQYWASPDRPYRYIPVMTFAEAFSSYSIGKNLSEELDIPFDKRYNHPAALSSSQYGVKKIELLKTNFDWQLLLMKRNLFIYVFKFIQLLLVALITMSVFCRATLHHDTVDDGGLYLGELYFSMVIILFNGFTEVSMLVAKLPILYKHRDLHFYPSWAYTVPSWFLSIPTSLIESGFWVAVTYYVVGFDPNITRFLRQFVLFFFLHQMSIGLFRLMGSLGRNMIVANTFGSFAMLIVMALGGYIISRDRIPPWWIWGFWISPLMYAQDAASVNEFLGHSWDKASADNSTQSLGRALLKARNLFPESYWYWIGVGALVGYTILFNILFTLFLSKLSPLGKHQAIVSKVELEDREKMQKGEPVVIQLRDFLQHSGSFAKKSFKQRGMVLPFQQVSMSFSNISYYVDVPLELKQQGISEDRLKLLNNITGAFRPGVLTALVGVSGAGKTTLMDVLAGRKTGGTIEGNISISGYPKRQETFARISGYCEQNDIHSPCLTVHESLLFSAWLRLPSDIDLQTQKVAIEFPYVFVQALIYCTIFYSLASFEWAASKFLWYTFFMYFTMLYFTFYGMMTTAVTPNHNVAAIIAAPFYMLWNLFSGFMIPHKRIPIWWRWYYWANPIAWSLYGLVASQYSDSDRLIKLSDGAKLISTRLLVKNVFGFRHDFIGIAGFMVVGFCMLFALIFAFAIKSFNFQRR
ncbi:UNVERIFIED_CONTAM: ABC transporter G family member 32 [Sesamum latifolium]|uniref:ABC transporter G family member 32 n=1 Tax=Sesamum latifolium TaxID=2727402 RepID=A0AAW2VCW6_9LAMI